MEEKRPFSRSQSSTRFNTHRRPQSAFAPRTSNQVGASSSSTAPASARRSFSARPERTHTRPSNVSQGSTTPHARGAHAPHTRGTHTPRNPLAVKSVRTGVKGMRRNSALARSTKKPENNIPIPPLGKNVVRIVPLGGVEEIGRNMTAIEFNDDIWVVDCGFMFKDENTPGVDYILPNTEYLEDRKDQIRGMIITHGHLDHIGGIPYIIDRIGNPPIYTRRLTGVMIKKRQEEFPHLPEVDIREVEVETTIKIGSLPVTFFGVTHTIPDSMGVIIETPYGGVVITGDIKLNHINGDVSPEEERSFSIFHKKKTLVLLMDSTNVERPGWSVPESRVFETFEGIIATAEHRLIIASFASQLERVIKIIEIAERNGKKVVVEGRSMKVNLGIAENLGLLKTKKGTLISGEEMKDYPESKIIVLTTGAQGDTFAALMRIAEGNHKTVSVTPYDTIVLSSSVIPGNEKAVQKLKDNLTRRGAHIVTYHTSDVHASGHGNQEEGKWIHSHIRPKFFIPQHGYHYMLRVHGDVIQESAGVPPENIVLPDNGSIIEISDEGNKIEKLQAMAPHATRIVEGMHVREMQDAVIRDRQALANDGIFVVVVTLHIRTGKLRKSPDIISRGFVYMRESQDLLNQTRLLVKKTVENSFRKNRGGNVDKMRAELADVLSDFLLQETHKQPMVIPVIVGV